MFAIFSSLTAILFIWLGSSEALSYFGDTSIHAYLQMFCRKSENVPNAALLLIDNLFEVNFTLSSVPSEKKPQFESRIGRHLKKLNCPFEYIPSASPFKLASLLKSELQWKYKKLTLLFDFTTTNSLKESRFVSVLSSLDNLYFKCSNCLPFLCLFDVSADRLTHWSEKIISTLKRDFRIVLISNSRSNVTVHINPVTHGCRLVNGIVVPRTKKDFDQLKIPSEKCNLGWSTLNASYNNILPFCNVEEKNGKTVFKYAIETEILQILQKKFNFHSNMIDGKGSWGMLVKRSNGTKGWNGVVGHVVNKTSDMALCFISRTLARMKVVTFSEPLYMDELTFMSRSPNLRTRDWLVFSPFNGTVWACNVLSLAILVFVFYGSLRVKWKNVAKQPSGFTIFIELFSIYMGQSAKMKWGEVAQIRILYGTWVLSVLIIANSYGGCFYSILAVPEFESPIDTILDIERISTKDDGFIITIADSSYLQMMTTAEPDEGIFYSIGQHINRTEQQMVALDKEVVQAVEQRRQTTVIATRLYLATIRRVFARKPLHIGTDAFSMDLVCFIFAKKSPFQKPFSKIIKRMYQTGLVEKLLQGTFDRLPWKGGGSLHRNPTVSSATNSVAVLAPKDLRSVYILWSFGIALALSAFVYECLSYLLYTRVDMKAKTGAWLFGSK